MIPLEPLEAIRDYLISRSALTDLVPAARIVPGWAPATTPKPYVTFLVVSGSHFYHLAGPAGVAKLVVQVDAWATSMLEARRIRSVIVFEVDGLRAELAPQLELLRTGIENERDTVTKPVDAGDAAVFGAGIDFAFIHREAVRQGG